MSNLYSCIFSSILVLTTQEEKLTNGSLCWLQSCHSSHAGGGLPDGVSVKLDAECGQAGDWWWTTLYMGWQKKIKPLIKGKKYFSNKRQVLMTEKE